MTAQTIAANELVERLRKRVAKWEATGPYARATVPLPELQAVLATITRLTDELAGVKEALGGVFDHFAEGRWAPGHCHTVPGIWDADNTPDKAGKPCDWCAKWERARALLGRE